MDKLKYTPVHKETGLALPVLITPEDFTVKRSRQHHKEHPSTRAELQGYAGKALRYSVTQQIPNHMHMGGFEGSYHQLFWGAKVLPEDNRGKIKRALLNLVVIPRQAIKLTGDGYEEVELSDDEYSFISHPEITRIEGNSPKKRQFIQKEIGSAILKHSLEQVLAQFASQKEQYDFTKTLDIGRERELGNLIIRRAIDESIKPALETYEEAKLQGMVNPRRLGLRQIVRNFVPESDFSNYYEFMRNQFRSVQEIGTVALQTEVDKVKLAA